MDGPKAFTRKTWIAVSIVYGNSFDARATVYNGISPATK